MATLTAAQQKQLADMMASLTKMKSDISSGKVTGLTPSTTATTKPSTTTTKSTTYIPPTPSPAPMGGYKPLDPSILNTITSNLGPNMQNDPAQVQALQQALVNAGYMRASDMATGPGTYGPKTTAAVSLWQTQNGIPTSGNPGYFGPVSKNFIKTGKNPSGSPISPIDPRDNPIYDSSVQNDLGIEGTGLEAHPQESYSPLSKIIERGSPEYKAALKKLSFDYYDIMQQQLNAQTEQEHAVANATWQNLKRDMEQALGITLSSNAMQAGEQIEALKNQSGQQGTQGSGLESESIDDYLRKIRMSDQQSRDQHLSKEESSQMDYMLKYASPDEIKAFKQKNPALAEKWGMNAADSMKKTINFKALKKKYPNLTDDQINNYIKSVFDENGNSRSALYQGSVTGKNMTEDPGNLTTSIDPVTGKTIYNVTPGDYGSLDIARARTQFGDEGVGSLGAGADKAARDAYGNTPVAEYNESGAGSEGSNSFVAQKPYTGKITPIKTVAPAPLIKTPTKTTKTPTTTTTKTPTTTTTKTPTTTTTKTPTTTGTAPTSSQLSSMMDQLKRAQTLLNQKTGK